jgi:hypothetical protein
VCGVFRWLSSCVVFAFVSPVFLRLSSVTFVAKDAIRKCCEGSCIYVWKSNYGVLIVRGKVAESRDIVSPMAVEAPYELAARDVRLSGPSRVPKFPVVCKAGCLKGYLALGT